MDTHLLSWVEAGLGFLLTGLVGGLVYEIREARNSITELNVNMAKVLEKIGFHEKDIARHDERLSELEKRKRK